MGITLDIEQAMARKVSGIKSSLADFGTLGRVTLSRGS